jgi:predicted ABC-type ATPase
MRGGFMSRHPKPKNVYVIAGPNGSGKTTFARNFLPHYVHCPNFVNADLIAQGLAPFDPRLAAIKAGNLVLSQIEEYSFRGADFAFETTLSGQSYGILLQRLKEKRYATHLFFLWIPSAELAISRVKDRVAKGGHHVPADDIRRRFKRGLFNFFNVYQPFFDSWMLFDNSWVRPVLIAKKNNGVEIINDKDLYQKIKMKAGLP